MSAHYSFLTDGRPKPHRVTFREDGKRRTRHFAKKLDALEFLDEVKVQNASDVLSVSTDERLLVAHLRTVASRCGLDLVETSQRFVEFMKNESMPRIEIKEACEAFLLFCERKNLRPKTLSQYRLYCEKFASTRGKRFVSSITRDEVLAFILGFYSNDESRDKIKVPLMAWLRWCERKGWADGWRDPLKWERSISDEKVVTLLAPEFFEKLLPELPPSCRFGVAIMGFAGVRPEELVSSTSKRVLRWEDIRLSDRIITLPGQVTKTRRQRVLYDIPANLIAWLETCEKKDRVGPVIKCSMRTYRRNRQAALERLGFDPKWPQDVLRHSFASYGFHVLGVERAIEFTGHTRPKVFFRHYKGAVSAENAQKWFEIYP